MSVLQEIKGYDLYFIILSRRKSNFHAKYSAHCSHGLPVIIRTDDQHFYQEVKGFMPLH